MPRYPADGKIYNVEAGLLTYSARRLPNCRTISGKECRFTPSSDRVAYGAGTYSSRYCFGFTPNSFLISSGASPTKNSDDAKVEKNFRFYKTKNKKSGATTQGSQLQPFQNLLFCLVTQDGEHTLDRYISSRPPSRSNHLHTQAQPVPDEDARRCLAQL